MKANKLVSTANVPLSKTLKLLTAPERIRPFSKRWINYKTKLAQFSETLNNLLGYLGGVLLQKAQTLDLQGVGGAAAVAVVHWAHWGVAAQHVMISGFVWMEQNGECSCFPWKHQTPSNGKAWKHARWMNKSKMHDIRIPVFMTNLHRLQMKRWRNEALLVSQKLKKATCLQ